MTDIALPAMSGLELAPAISKKRPKTKVLFVSAYKEKFDTGELTVVPKPFTME